MYTERRPRVFGLGTRISWLLALIMGTFASQAASPNAPAPALDWLWHTGGPGQDESYAIAVDAAGNVYATGAFSGAVDFDPGPGGHPLTADPVHGTDTWVTKVNASGELVWARALGGTIQSAGQLIRVDANGNVFVVVRRTPVPFEDDRGIFVTKLDAGGEILWSAAVGPNAVTGMELDAAGNLYLTGWFVKTADISNGEGTRVLTSNGSLDAFVMKLSNQGEVLWARSFGGPGVDRGQALAVASSGMVFVAGYFQHTVDFDPGPHAAQMTSSGPENLFLAAFGPDGTFAWAKRFERGATSEAQTVSGASSLLDGGGRVLALTGDGSVVSIFAHDGAPLSSRPLDATAHALVLDSAGAIHVAATTNVGAVLKSLDPNGVDRWSWPLHALDTSPASRARIHALATDADKTVYATGAFRGTVDFAPGWEGYTRTSAGRSDLFVARFHPVLGPLDPALDSDGDGMPDVFEILHGFDRFDPADGGSTDTDGNGLTNAEESALADRFPIDPRDPLLPRRDWHVSAVHGDDARSALEGGGAEEFPWRTIGMALATLDGLARENFPVRILLDDTPNWEHPAVGSAAVYEETVALIPFVTLQAREPAAAPLVHIRPAVASTTPVITGAQGSNLRHLSVLPAWNGLTAGALLEANGVAMDIRDVTFDGEMTPGSLGIRISGEASSDTRIQSCAFLNLGTGILAIGSGAAVADSQFDAIAADGPHSRAIAIGYEDAKGGQALNLGRSTSILDSGFNRFRNLAGDAKAIVFLNPPLTPVSAQYNDWGVYTPLEISSLLAVPGDTTRFSAVDTTRFLPGDQTLLEGAITGVLLDAVTLEPIAARHQPEVYAGAVDIVAHPDPATGIFVFPAFAQGDYTLIANANGYGGALAECRVTPGRIPVAPRILLSADDASIVWRLDINNDGVVNAIDVQLVINAALGIALPPGIDADVDKDGQINAVDVQKVINAALGLL